MIVHGCARLGGIGALVLIVLAFVLVRNIAVYVRRAAW